jgi:hypothetical protein
MADIITTALSLGTEQGLAKQAKFVSLEINDDKKFIRVFYKEQWLTSTGVVFKEGPVLSYLITGAEFEAWDTQLGVPTIRPAIINNLKTIYKIA